MAVDDAFITWRYGKNYIDAHIWNYNPSWFDLTQAYTNPVYAALSIIPAALRLDVVFFFKIISTLTLLLFVTWYKNKVKGALLLLMLFFALPSTFAHAYAGLETFLFAALMTSLLISLYERSVKASLVITLLLFATRPESWMLIALVPFYIMIGNSDGSDDYHSLSRFFQNLRIKKGVLCFLALALPMLFYFLLNYNYFGSFLPNTFSVKKSTTFDVAVFLSGLLFVSPLLILLLKGRYYLAVSLIAFFGAMAYQYATSHLIMNYFGRFNYHIFAPIYLFAIYLSSKLTDSSDILLLRGDAIRRYSFSDKDLVGAYLAMLVVIFYMMDWQTDYLYYVSQYNRGLESQAKIGKVLNSVREKYGIRSFAMGDAGMAAFHSNINALDNLLLGSSRATKYGLTEDLISQYDIDVIAFHATPQFVHRDGFNQRPLFDWATKNGFKDHCFVLLGGDYGFRMFARQYIHEFDDLCAESYRHNIRTNTEFALEALATPPWKLWHE
jgi:hypothetical protein